MAAETPHTDPVVTSGQRLSAFQIPMGGRSPHPGSYRPVTISNSDADRDPNSYPRFQVLMRKLSLE